MIAPVHNQSPIWLWSCRDRVLGYRTIVAAIGVEVIGSDGRHGGAKAGFAEEVLRGGF
ncbi:hypothetical protein GCM10007887_41330 [Methylobacterium haplocladii]|nr:hypothetical protein GCM10007887_41330 [Methylobacterium haplocladii]